MRLHASTTRGNLRPAAKGHSYGGSRWLTILVPSQWTPTQEVTIFFDPSDDAFIDEMVAELLALKTET